MIINTFLFWGAFGMFTEICFTAVRDFVRNRKLSFIGHTSLWMFPIYSIGLTYGFDFIKSSIHTDLLRYAAYPLWIWGVELLVGIPSSKIGIRIWDYRYLPHWAHWRGIISFVHYPLWVGFGILVETIK